MRIEKSEVINQIQATGLIPVIRTKTEAAALEAIEAISAGGLHIFEITMSVPNAIGIIENLKAKFGKKALIGAGTVLDAETAKDCIAAGAEFIVSPIFDSKVIEKCQQHDATTMAGAMTVTEIFVAWGAGADFVKVFPADALGGARYLEAVKTVLPEVLLVPTGGVTLETAAGLIKAGAAALGIGGGLISQDRPQTGGADEITNRTQALIKIVKQARQ